MAPVTGVPDAGGPVRGPDPEGMSGSGSRRQLPVCVGGQPTWGAALSPVDAGVPIAPGDGVPAGRSGRLLLASRRGVDAGEGEAFAVALEANSELALAG